MTAPTEKAVLAICKACSGTGHADKVWRGNHAPGDCEPCGSTGWVDESTGRRERDPATEKAAPIPAEVLALAKAEAENFEWAARQFCEYEGDLANDIREAIARAILADREARPSLPDSREEQIRAEAAEDERDRLYAEACKPVPGTEENETVAALACAAATWLRLTQGVQPPARSRQGGNNG